MTTIDYDFKKRVSITKIITLEDDHDINEHSLARITPKSVKNKQGINVVFLLLNGKQWTHLGIRDTLWGQSRVIDGVIYCYGRWSNHASYRPSKHFEEPVKSMNEATVGLAHELSHGLYHIKDKEDLTHAYFYGYKKLEDKDQERYEKTPDALGCYENILEGDETINITCVKPVNWKKPEKNHIEELSRIVESSQKPHNRTGDETKPYTKKTLDTLGKALRKLSGLVPRIEKVLRRKSPTLKDLARAIRKAEGWHEGSLTYRLNNPGALRHSSRQTGTRDGYAYFNDYTDGWKALLHQLRLYATGESQHTTGEETLEEFVDIYAPPQDGNKYNKRYVKVLTQELGVGKDFQIKDLV